MKRNESKMQIERAGGHPEDTLIKSQDVREISYPPEIKWTRQRKAVYAVLEQASEPLSATDIYHRIDREEAAGNFAISTVYRILATFEEKHLVTKTNWMDDGTLVYELNRGGHTHYAICLNCHKRVALKSCPFAHIHLPIGGEPGMDDFQVTGHKLELYGYCQQCRKNM